MTHAPLATAAPARPIDRTGLIEVSTEAHRERDKVAFWADMVCQHFVPAECNAVAAPERFHGAMALRQIGRANVAQIVAGGQRVTRTARLMAKASEEYFLVNIQRGAQRPDAGWPPGAARTGRHGAVFKHPHIPAFL